MTSSQYKKSEIKHLANILECSSSDIETICDNTAVFYYEYQEYKIDKSGFVKTFRDGTPKKRTITPSKGKLKRIQTRIKSKILDPIPMPIHVQGATKQRSNITNAKIHQGHKFILTTDLMNFFPCITHRRVFAAFLQSGYSHHMASLLTILTTFKGCLPQGAPTSPQLSNLCMLEIDERLLDHSANLDITYTRFIDDLTFSSHKDFVHTVPILLDVIKESGLKINYRKTAYNSNKTITGIDVFNNFVDVPTYISDRADLSTLTPGYNPIMQYINRVRSTNSNTMVARKKQPGFQEYQNKISK